MRRTAAVAVVAVLMLAPVAACRRGTESTSAAAATAQAPAPAADPKAFTGTVAETMNSGGYTYAKLQGGPEDVWIAASEFSTKAGDRLTVALNMPMQNFQSKSLGRTFPLVYFVSEVTRDGERVAGPRAGTAGSAASAGSAGGAGGAPVAPMSSHGAGAPVATTVEPVAPAPGGIAVADVWAKRTSLSGRQVTVRGKVVKVNDQILGRNWIHLQDGSGSADARTNDLTITTADSVKVGDVITVAGVLAIDKDFGAGYAYGAIVENAKVIK